MHAPWEPFDISCEQQLLGAILLNNDVFPIIESMVESSHFYEVIHQQLFEIIASLAKVGKLASPLTIKPFLPADIDICGMKVSQYLARLAASATTIVNCRDFAQVIRDLADVRAIGEVAEQLRPRGGVDPVEQASYGVDALDSIVSGRALASVRAMTMPQTLTRAVDAAAVAYQNEGKILGIPYGLADLDAKMLGAQPGHLIVIAARPSMGKAQPLTAKIRTTSGWKLMGEINVGDKLKSIDGAQSFVSGVFEKGRRQVFNITFSDDRSTRACAEHLWRVHNRKWAEPKILSTAELIEKIRQPSYADRIWIDMPGTWERGGQRGYKLPLDPWLIGALIGDGCFSGGRLRFSGKSEELLNRLRRKLPSNTELRHEAGYNYSITSKAARHRANGSRISEVIDAVRSLGLWGTKSATKFIPTLFLNAPAFERMELLRGLLDTDGWVEKHGSICLATVSAQLAIDIQELVRSLGGWCSYRKKETTFTYKGERRHGQLAYVLYISHPSPKSLFTLSKKIARAPVRQERIKRPTITSIVPDGEEECRCISVTHPSRLYITDDYVVTHNSAVALSFSRNMAYAGFHGVFYSLEMGDIELSQRMIADEMFDEGRMTYWQIRSGRFHESVFKRITEAAERLSRLPLVIEQQPGLSVSQIAARARQRKRRGKLDFIVVDHLGLIASSGRYTGSRVNEIGEMTASLKGLAKELDCAVFLLSQLNRAVEAREDKRPRMADLRESGSIEQDADVVIMLYRKAYYLERSEPPVGSPEHLTWQTQLEGCHNELQFLIEKQRAGPVGMIRTFIDVGCNAVRPWPDFQNQMGE